jgi:WD40 repeat protein
MRKALLTRSRAWQQSEKTPAASLHTGLAALQQTRHSVHADSASQLRKTSRPISQANPDWSMMLRMTWQRTAVLTNPTGGDQSVAFSPDGKTLATGDLDDSTYLWDAR